MTVVLDYMLHTQSLHSLIDEGQLQSYSSTCAWAGCCTTFKQVIIEHASHLALCVDPLHSVSGPGHMHRLTYMPEHMPWGLICRSTHPKPSLREQR